MAGPDRYDVPLGNDDISLLIEALDSHEYWQLSEPDWRHSGAVILPSDDEALWEERPSHTDEEQAAIAAIQQCRALADRLRPFAADEFG